METETRRYFSVSKIHLDPSGWATHVLWSEINARSNGNVSAPVVAPVSDVVDAIHDGAHVSAILLPPHAHLPNRQFEVVQRWDGSETIDLVKEVSPEAGVVIKMRDLAYLDLNPSGKMKPKMPVNGPSRHIFAVSQVQLDEDGRVTDVRWGRVNTVKNTWAGAEQLAPVATVVAALRAGDQVFALFPALHGHLPERQFVQADYDGGRQTIVLAGPTASEREIHDMDRIAPTSTH